MGRRWGGEHTGQTRPALFSFPAFVLRETGNHERVACQSDVKRVVCKSMMVAVSGGCTCRATEAEAGRTVRRRLQEPRICGWIRCAGCEKDRSDDSRALSLSR